MATHWALRSCQCKIIMTQDRAGEIVMETWEQKCALHKDVIDEQLLDTLLTHDRQWNDSLTGTLAEINTKVSTLKSAEYTRIKKLGDGLRNANFRANKS